MSLGWESSLGFGPKWLYICGYVLFGERRKRDVAKGKMCKHQAIDVLKIHSEKKIWWGGGNFRALKKIKYNINYEGFPKIQVY